MGDKKESTLLSTGQFLITISTKQHKVVKYIDQNGRISTLKIVTLSTANQELLLLMKGQLEHVKEYLVRRHGLPSQLGLGKYLQVEQKCETEVVHLKISTEFNQNPTLYSYYLQLQLQGDQLWKRGSDRNSLVDFSEELLQLILRGGGIDNFFYTPHNVFVSLVPKNNSWDFSKLTLNFTSTAGLKFIYLANSVSNEEFKQIFPCLPPSTYELIAEHKYDQLNVLIKIRSFAFLLLTFVLKRVPFLLDDIRDALINPNEEQIKRKVKNSPKIFLKLLELRKDEKLLKKASAETKILLKQFFIHVFVICDIQSWPEVHKIVFMCNYFNAPLSPSNLAPSPSQDQPLMTNREYANKLAKLIWSTESKEQKQFYISRGLLKDDPQKNRGRLSRDILGVYLLVRLNASFHCLLRSINIVQFVQKQRFSQEVNKVVTQLLTVFNLEGLQVRDLSKIDVTAEIERYRHASEVSTYQQCLLDKLDLEKWSPFEMMVVNPFTLLPERATLPPDQTAPDRGMVYFDRPSRFLQSMLTRSHSQLVLLGQAVHEQLQLTTFCHRLELVSEFEQQLWLM